MASLYGVIVDFVNICLWRLSRAGKFAFVSMLTPPQVAELRPRQQQLTLGVSVESQVEEVFEMLASSSKLLVMLALQLFAWVGMPSTMCFAVPPEQMLWIRCSSAQTSTASSI